MLPLSLHSISLVFRPATFYCGLVPTSFLYWHTQHYYILWNSSCVCVIQQGLVCYKPYNRLGGGSIPVWFVVHGGWGNVLLSYRLFLIRVHTQYNISYFHPTASIEAFRLAVDTTPLIHGYLLFIIAGLHTKLFVACRAGCNCAASCCWHQQPPLFGGTPHLCPRLRCAIALHARLQYIIPLRLIRRRCVISAFGRENIFPHAPHGTFVRARSLGIDTTDSYNLTYAMLCVVTWFFTKACLVYLACNTNGWVWEYHLRTLSASIRFNISLFFTARSIPARVLNLIFVQQSAQT